MSEIVRVPRGSNRATRIDNRLPLILNEAARLFREKGYEATTMRDIAVAVGMLPGSLYYHFATKEDLLVAVYERGVRLIIEKVQSAAAKHEDPWQRLEAAAVAHLETSLKTEEHSLVVMRVLPRDLPKAAERVTKLRDEYDKVFVDLVADLPLPPKVDRRLFRLMLLGALNWSQNWYRENGRHSPRSIARNFIAMLADAQKP